MNHRFQQDVPSSDRISKPEKPRETSLSRRDLFRTAAALPLAGSGIVAAPATSGAAGVQTGTGLRIVVVGAGAFGGWTALHLQRQGADVTLLDTWGPETHGPAQEARPA